MGPRGRRAARVKAARVKAALILGTQLFEEHPAFSDPDIDLIIVVESPRAFARRPFHAHKLVLVLSGLRHLVARLREVGRAVHHVPLSAGQDFAAALGEIVTSRGIDGIAWMSVTDRGVDDRLRRLCARLGVRTRLYPDALFVTPESVLDDWFAQHPRARMEDFYRWQRRRTGILIDGAEPAGGRWNFDADNREPLPKGGIPVPGLPLAAPDEITAEAIAEVAARYPDAPGDPAQFWLPVTPDDSRLWLDRFVRERLEMFGRYEDAMAPAEPFLFHSVLSPLTNVGLVPVQEVLDAALAARGRVPLAGLEGFVRQILGWREYMRGAYRAWPHLSEGNYFGLTRELEPWWYSGRDIPDDVPIPVRTVLERVHRWGYAHHIERLMVLGNWFLLQGYRPQSVNDWFTALFVDAYEWVMAPNVLGMSQYSDGGRVATKPYISGGAYLQRMGSWWPSDRDARESAFTSAYWEFLGRHEDLLVDNPRLSLPLAQMRRRRG